MRVLENTSRPARFWILLVSALYLFVELLSFAGLALLRHLKQVTYAPAALRLTERERQLVRLLIDDEHSVKQLSPALGWTNKPNSHDTRYVQGIDRTVARTLNSLGARGIQEYLAEPDEGVTRILAFGDSFTFGAEVDDDECWSEVLTTSDNQYEVLNFGLGGAGVDQAFLYYLEKAGQLNPAMVLVGVMTENIARHVNVFRPFYTTGGMPASKPRYSLDGDDLRLLPNPMPSAADYVELLENEEQVLERLGQHDYFYQRSYYSGGLDVLPSVRLYKVFRDVIRESGNSGSIYIDGRYNTTSEAFQITARLLQKFYLRVTEDGVVPVIVMFPTRKDIADYRNKVPMAYEPLLEWLDARELEYIDLAMAFEKLGRGYHAEAFFSGMGHYSVLGNQLVAQYLAEYLSCREGGPAAGHVPCRPETP